MKPWTEKYKPEKISDLLQQEALLKLKPLIQNYKKPILIYGPTGNGKTVTIITLTKYLNYEILELNASDIRNSESIENIIGNSIRQQSLFYKGKIILVDELDGISGTEDRGGLQALLKLLNESKFPMVLIANDPWGSKLTSLRRKCNLIEFKKYDSKIILNSLRGIAKKENIKINENILAEIIKLSKGDLRAAINDLQLMSINPDLEVLSDRGKKETIFNILKLIFQSKDISFLNIFDKTDLDLDECLLWLDENLPLEYKGKDLANAYDVLSRADVFRGRIKRWQHWRFLVYQNALMSLGIAYAKEKGENKFTQYKRSSRILKLWIAKQKNVKKKSIAGKIAKFTHTSTKRAIKDMPYYIKILNRENMVNLNLSEEEIDWLDNIK